MICSLNYSEGISRSCPISEYSVDRFANDTFRILKQFNKSPPSSNLYTPAITHIGISAGKFLDSVTTKSISDLFSKQATKNEMIKSTENTTQWQDYETIDDNDEDSEDRSIEKPITTTISEEQGEFFRKFRKSDEQTKPEPKPEVKTTTSSSSISSFFSRYTSNENVSRSSPEKLDDDQYTICSKCQKSILVWDVPEHEDYHYARELQMEENRSNSITQPRANTETTKSTKTVKRKNDKPKTNIQTLDSFLNKKSKNE